MRRAAAAAAKAGDRAACLAALSAGFSAGYPTPADILGDPVFASMLRGGTLAE